MDVGGGRGWREEERVKKNIGGRVVRILLDGEGIEE